MKMHLSILVACMMVATGASATALTAGGSSQTVSTTDCTLLKEGVNLNLSKDVAGAYACEGTTNVIAVTTCHPNGRKAAGGTNNYFYTTSSKGGKPAESSDQVCDVAGSAADGKAGTEAGVAAPDAGS